MSILIKNMEMPKNCDDCFLGEFYCDKCQHIDGYMMAGGLPYSCPLVPVPKHGELIDLSAKVNAQYYDDADEEWSIKTVTVEDILYGICEEMPPTIIEAEEGE